MRCAVLCTDGPCYVAAVVGVFFWNFVFGAVLVVRPVIFRENPFSGVNYSVVCCIYFPFSCRFCRASFRPPPPSRRESRDSAETGAAAAAVGGHTLDSEASATRPQSRYSVASKLTGTMTSDAETDDEQSKADAELDIEHDDDDEGRPETADADGATDLEGEGGHHDGDDMVSESDADNMVSARTGTSAASHAAGPPKSRRYDEPGAPLGSVAEL